MSETKVKLTNSPVKLYKNIQLTSRDALKLLINLFGKKRMNDQKSNLLLNVLAMEC